MRITDMGNGIPLNILVEKNEIKTSDKGQIKRNRDDLVGLRHLVHCPDQNYGVVSTLTCKDCGFWLGFAATDPQKPLGPGNAYSVCAHPVGRRIFSV